MRASFALAPLVLAACAAGSSSPDSTSAATVRERLSGPTRMFVSGDASAGSIAARRRTHDGWIDGATPLAIESGDVSAQVVGDELALDGLTVHLAPIALPDDIFGTPAQLTDIIVSLPESAHGAIAWASADAATARVPLALDIAWAIRVDAGKTPLATVHVPPVDVDVTLDGDGDDVDATLALAADGALWSWAGILELTHIDLALGAQTTN